MIKKDAVNLETIKTANREKILHLLMDKRELTKQEISKKTGISVPTVTNNINRLLKKGIVAEAGLSASTGGRRPVVLRFKPDSKYTFGVDLSPENVRIILANLDLQIQADLSFANRNFTTMDEIMGQIHHTIREILSRNKTPRDNILGIGISLYGTVNEERMILEMAPNLKIKEKNIHFRKYGIKFGFPLFIENDANSSALAMLLQKEAKNIEDLVYIAIGTGIGCGILIKGQLLKGENKRAGEFGHMTIASNGRRCACGSRDCWELYASERALIADYNRRSGKRIKEIAKILSLVKSNDQDALDAWHRYLDYLAIGIKNIILFLYPGCIVIGGKISRYEDLLIAPLKDRVFKENSFYDRDDVAIMASTLKENASIIGAALLPLQKLLFLNEKVI